MKRRKTDGKVNCSRDTSASVLCSASEAGPRSICTCAERKAELHTSEVTADFTETCLLVWPSDKRTLCLQLWENSKAEGI